MGILKRRLVTADGDDTFSINLEDDERAMLSSLLPQLRELIEGRDSIAWRLFPNAYIDDREAAAEYEDMVGEELREKRLASIETVETTIERTTVDTDELMAWMGAVNDLRLVLGTRLDVTEESDIDDYNTDTARTLFLAYWRLGWFVEEIVEALSA